MIFSKLSKFALVASLAFASMSNASAAGLTPGMTIGLGGDYVFKINENTNFAPEITPGNKTTFNASKDKGWGGNVSFGYMMENGILGELELGYRDLKYVDSKTTTNTLETTNMLGLLRGTYYIDLGSMVYPYITAAAGAVRINAKGKIDTLDFSDLTAWKVAADAGLGLAVSMDSFIVSLGAKASWNQAISDSKTYTPTMNPTTLTFPTKFGSIDQLNYSVVANLKMILG
jgi:opacity protein-like surface antigen